jgi:ribosomal protein S15P/S13E
VRNNSNNGKVNSNPSLGARLALIGQFMVTFGDILSSTAAVILIEEGIEEDKQDETEKKEQEQQLAKMQKQIDSLQRELRQMKKDNNF